MTLEITTMNKPDFCLNNARILAENPDVLENVKEILIVDQGTQKVEDQEGFAAVREALGGKLRIINQANLGGSGGFARGMFEAVENGSDYALLLDDDIVVEPESIVRLLTFADHCRKPTIVGGHMFDLYNRSVLHTFGEVVDPYRIVPALPHADMETRHDFSVANLRQTPWLHRRVDVDYNGWWMCLIPTKVIQEIGLSLPLFIKWDDAEYGLRAREAGFATVSMPGAAVWHVSWIDKDDLVGWQAYFHARNRLITTLIHSPYPKGGRVLRESFQSDVKHLVSMQYFTEHGRIDALRDLLKGPDDLHKVLGTKLPEINALKADYPDAQLKEDVDDFPAPKIGRGPMGGTVVGLPSKKQLIPWGIKTVARQLIKAPGPESAERPQGYLAHRDNRWYRVAHYDSVVVSNAEGTGASWYQRDPKKLKSMLTEATTAARAAVPGMGQPCRAVPPRRDRRSARSTRGRRRSRRTTEDGRLDGWSNRPADQARKRARAAGRLRRPLPPEAAGAQGNQGALPRLGAGPAVVLREAARAVPDLLRGAGHLPEPPAGHAQLCDLPVLRHCPGELLHGIAVQRHPLDRGQPGPDPEDLPAAGTLPGGHGLGVGSALPAPAAGAGRRLPGGGMGADARCSSPRWS